MTWFPWPAARTPVDAPPMAEQSASERPDVDADVVAIVLAIEAETPDMIGPKKAREASRRLALARPGLSTRARNLLIEIAVNQCLPDQ